MRILVIYNPRSGLQDGTIFTFIRHFAKADDEVVLRVLGADKPIAEYLEDASGFDLVVSAGGDGTVSTICYALSYSKIPILPFPSGTGNLLFTNLDLPDEPVALAALAHEPYILDFDMGEVSFISEGNPVTKGFAVAAGAGFDASIMKAAEGLKSSFGSAAYVLAALSHANPVFSKFTIELDDQTVTSEGIAVLLLNFAKIHTDISITQSNNALDGMLEVTILKSHNAVELLPVLLSALFDRSASFTRQSNIIETHLSKSARISADPPLQIQYDGETPDVLTPIEARILPMAIRLVVPERTYRRFMDVEAIHST
ncbi:MAG: NAD(+)/NADH kinase [Coriobacteriia bacterium]|nr:NAD(+)/NADH kinase [Coriobacteriia bacterium]